MIRPALFRAIARRCAAFAAAAVIAWGCGLAWFILDATRSGSPRVPRADAIVALTGGVDRIPTALRLLRDGAAPKLLLSGVGRGIALRDVGRAAGIDTDPLASRITVGHAAEDTRGNAEETAAWASAEGVRSLVVVTSGYHMRRAMLEIGRALPGVPLYPVPVAGSPGPGHVIVGPVLYATEYTKLLVASVQPQGSLQTGLWGLWTSLWAEPPPASPASAANPSKALIDLVIFARGGGIPPVPALWG